MKVSYISNKRIYPAFGVALEKGEKIYIRKDLPDLVKRYLLAHEKFHVLDFRKLKKKKQSVFWCEIKANAYGFYKEPIGAIITLIMSLTPARIRLTFNIGGASDKFFKRFLKEIKINES